MYTLIIHALLVVSFTLRVLARDDLLPSSRMAWFMVILTIPFAGTSLYFLFGEVDLGHRAKVLQKKIFTTIRQKAREAMGSADDLKALADPQFLPAFKYASSINSFFAVAGNKADLMPDAMTARARMIEDIDAANDTVHILCYIWLEDKTGTNMAHAVIRAAKRGITCRIMVDGLGSRAFVKSELWRQMDAAGVQLAVALPIDKPIRTILTSRLDLRNHRKITVVDGKIAYCGSQNCADPEFRPKAKYAPWIDIQLRLQGPVVAQLQLLFASDWMKERQTPIECFPLETEFYDNGFVSQAVGDGPTERMRAAPQMFSTLIDSAQNSLIITTPYFVPDATVIDALCSAAYRQVEVTVIVPRKNDSWVVASASKSFYRKLLQAGVKIYEFNDGLLHSKTLTIDGQAVFLGSSNLDIRSFDLNYENDVLIQDRTITAAVCARQSQYISRSTAVTLKEIAQWRLYQRIWYNVIATLGPIL